MNRRQLLQSLLAAPWMAPACLEAARDQSDPELRKHKIVRVSGFSHNAPRPKFVGKNSHLGDHGDSTGDHVLRIVTSEGAEGFGSGRVSEDVARRLVGQTVDDLWSDEAGSVGLLGRADHALFDLVGKIRGVPASRLLGSRGPEWVPVYDGSIYFNDLLPRYEKEGAGQLVTESQEGMKRGFRAFKIKVGRGFKWMPKQEGFRRDIDVVRAIRASVGPDVRLMVDANNGFDLDETMRWLDEAGPSNLYFIEEMFPEEVEQDRQLRDYIKAKGWATLVADGESAGEIEHFDAYLKAGVLDVLQPDIRAFGLSKQWALSRRIEQMGAQARLAPHNWGSMLGFFMQLVLARGIPNFLMAECDWCTSDLFDHSAFEWRDGKVRVPDTPGCGLAIREDVFRERYAPKAWTVHA